MQDESQALAKFWWGFEPAGVSDDGMPKFADCLMITLAVPPWTRFDRPATDADVDMYPGPYALFQKENKTRSASVEASGYPLAMWPVISPANLNMLAARDVYTVEQLAALAERGSSLLVHAPGELKELAERAKLMLQMTKDIGQFEVLMRNANGQIAALSEQVVELRNTIKAQDGMINNLKLKAA